MKKSVQLIHNDKAGDEEHGSKELLEFIESAGYDCHYSPDGEIDLNEHADIIAVAGGDGTIRTIAMQMLKRSPALPLPLIGVLPLGTANNISKTLGVAGEPDEIINRWNQSGVRKFDVGSITTAGETEYFLESFGYGLFPFLMEEMEKADKKFDKPEDSIRFALQVLHDLTDLYKPKNCSLTIDGVDHSGNFLLVEVMNTRSIGPNLVLAPDSDPGDGEFDVVLLPESDRQRFSDYIKQRLGGNEDDYGFQSIRAKKIVVCWRGPHVHADDQALKAGEDETVEIQVEEGRLNFLADR